MRVALQPVVAAKPAHPSHPRALRWRPCAALHRRRAAVLLVAAALVAPFGVLLPVPEASGQQPGAPLRLAQADRPTIEVVQTLLVEPATDAPLSLQLKTSGTLPPKSFIRITGLPSAASLSEGFFVRPGVWAVPLSALTTVRITVPTAQTGQSELTISLVTPDNTVLAQARTTLVVGAASLFSKAPSPARTATPATEPGGREAASAGPEVTLRMKGGAFELKGRLRAYEGGRYVIDNKVFGTMTLDGTNMECIGDGCPGPSPAVAAAPLAAGPAARPAVRSKVIGVSGSTAIGWELMPALIRSYAARIGARVTTLAGANPLEEQYKLIDSYGDEIALFDLKRYGTQTAFDDLERGSAAIGVASRPASDEEVARLSGAGTPNIRGAEHEHVLGLDGLVVIVAKDNPAVSLSIDNIAKIFAGGLTDWAEVGLPPGRINVYSASRRSGTFSTFDALVLQPRGLALVPSARLMLSTAEVADAVAADVNGIGVTSFAFVRGAKGLNVESLCGLIIRPSVFAVKTEEYPLTRRLYLYTTARPAHPHVKGFLDFALSRDAQPVIARAQFVDQLPDALDFDDQGGRIAYALNAPKEDFDIGEMRQLIADMNGARRLSITFRFRSGAIELDTKSRADVDRLVVLAATPELRGRAIMLLGFADAIGPYAGNGALSLRRATRVREVLLAAANGRIDPSRVVHKGYSELAPVACNDQPGGRNLNRRVEVWVRD